MSLRFPESILKQLVGFKIEVMIEAQKILRKHYDADNSVDENAITQAMEEYASQYQERIKELEADRSNFYKTNIELILDIFKSRTTVGVHQNDDGQEPFHHESNLFVDFRSIDVDEILEEIV